MKINLILNTQPKPSESFLRNWILNLKDNGYKISLIIFSKRFNTINKQYFGVKTLGLYSFKNIILFLLGFKFSNFKNRLLWQAINFGEPDIIHFSYTSLGVTCINSLAYRKNVKLFVSCRGHSENVRPYLEENRMNQLKLLFQKVDKIHCVSDEMKNRMIRDFGADEEKCFINRPAIDIDLFRFEMKSDLNVDKIIILTNGRLVSLKGYVFGLLAIKSLMEKGYSVEYRIIGEGNESDNIRFYIERLGLQNNVKLLGTMNSDTVIHEIKRADIYLSASLNEGISNAVIEAMAIGTIVISTDVNGMPELIKNNETGMLVRAFNDKEIEHAIISIIDKRIERECIINRARMHVEKNFNIKKQSKIFDEQYKLSVNV